MNEPFRTRRRVEFSDTDLGGIVHFSRFFIYMEGAEHELLRSLGTSVDFEINGQRAGWPRLAASCEYVSPARFEDVLEIAVRVLRKGRSSVTWGFEFSIGERTVARGQLTAACCLLDLPGGLKAVPIPAEIADRLPEVASVSGGG